MRYSLFLSNISNLIIYPYRLFVNGFLTKNNLTLLNLRSKIFYTKSKYLLSFTYPAYPIGYYNNVDFYYRDNFLR